jgi:hypothetical protein
MIVNKNSVNLFLLLAIAIATKNKAQTKIRQGVTAL